MRERRTPLDETDIALLDAVQRDGQATAQQLGDRLHLSASQAGRRRQRLEEAQVIQGYSARLDPEKLGLDVQALSRCNLPATVPRKEWGFPASSACVPRSSRPGP